MRFLAGLITGLMIFGIINIGNVTAATLFTDDFNDNTLDTTKWTTHGNYVSESGGTLNLYQAQTDAGGSVQSAAFNINATGLITFSNQVLYHQGNNQYKPTIGFEIYQPPIDKLQEIYLITGSYDYGVVNWGEKWDNIFFQKLDLSLSDPYANQPTNYYSGQILDQWFNEKIEYDPVSGLARYYMNDIMVLQSNVGGLNGVGGTLSVLANADGWWTGHSHLMDDVIVSQDNGNGSAPVPEPATMLLMGIGLAGLAGTRHRRKKQ